MDLDRLRQFVAIVEAGTLTAAAARVHLTQPALSRSLRLLEEGLGAPLFDRVGRGLVLTAAGRALLPRARALLDHADAVARDLERVAGRRYYDVRVGTVDSVATWLLPRALGPLRAALPDLAVKLHTGRTSDLLRRLAEDELDLVVAAWSGPPPAARATRVGRYDLRFYGRADRFPGLAEARTEAQVKAFPLVEIESLPGQPTMIGPDASSFAVAGSLASVKALVLAGFGVGALLDFMLSPEERARLVAAGVDHDPDCGLYVCPGPFWTGEGPARVTAAVADALAAALEGGAAAP